jgi:hypothetical protein
MMPVKFELTGFRSFGRFCEKNRNERLLKNRKRVAADDNNTGGEVHRVVQALDSGCRFAVENKVGAHAQWRVHAEFH